MKSPFPGMDPYLEHPALWPDVHNRLIAALADYLVPLVAPRYYVALERRAYLHTERDTAFVGRPDISVVQEAAAPAYTAPSADAEAVVLDVEVPMTGGDGGGDNYLEVREVSSGKLITIVELLSPANKLRAEGRRQYELKRSDVLHSAASLVEIDLLRAGEPMPLVGEQPRSDYRILVSRGWQRPRAQLYHFGVRDPIPSFPLPLTAGEDEPRVTLNRVLHDLYVRARFDLRLNYDEPPVPPLRKADSSWAAELRAEQSSPAETESTPNA